MNIGRSEDHRRAENMSQQAAHFDNKEPISPWPKILRSEGFRYHYIAKDLVIKQALDELAISAGSRVLDVGCGRGIWLDRVASSYGTTGIGIDVSKQSLASAFSNSISQSVFILTDARALPFANESFDLVTSLDVLEHVDTPEIVLDEIGRVAGRSGKILIYAVSKRNQFTYQWFERKFLGAIGVDLHPLAGHDPDLFIDPDMIGNRLNLGDFRLEKIEYFHAFFSSLFDRGLLVIYGVGKKLGLLAARNQTHKRLAVIFLTFTSIISRISLGTLLWLDRPWLRRGYANGFLAVARKDLHKPQDTK